MNLTACAAVVLLLLAGACARPDPGKQTPISTNTQAPGAAELRAIEAADDAAQAQTEAWLREENQPKSTNSGRSGEELQERIAKRVAPVRKSYEDFLKHYPENARAHLLFGSFLNDQHEERAAQAQWEQALALDPGNPAVYNCLAGRYAESGPVNKAFDYFSKAIEMEPAEPAYSHNFADALFVLRREAAAYYGITEQQVYGKVLLLYSNALKMSPGNFAFARDLAQTYYSVKPLPVDTALTAWRNAESVARKEIEREEARVHMARVEMLGGRFAEARSQLQSVTNDVWLSSKATLLQHIAEREKEKP